MAATTKIKSVVSRVHSLSFLLFIYLGCFFFFNREDQFKKRKKPKTSSWSYLKKLFVSSTRICVSCTQTPPSAPSHGTLTSARSSQNSLVSLIQPETQIPELDSPKPETAVYSDPLFLPLRNDIFPCTACGEIFPKSQLLEIHQAIKHAVSEMIDGESSTNIVKIIFSTGWPLEKTARNPVIHRVLKIHSSTKIQARFEEYREFVKAKSVAAARNSAGRRRLFERCAADGNELLRFHCSTFMCDLGKKTKDGSICNQQHCSICGIIKSGFSPKIDGISTFSTSLKAHRAVPEDVEEEFGFMNVKRAMLVCRVVAGRVGCDSDPEEDDVDKGEGGGYDSLVGRGSGSGALIRIDDEELLVFNPRAVLPCFVIVYSA